MKDRRANGPGLGPEQIEQRNNKKIKQIKFAMFGKPKLLIFYKFQLQKNHKKNIELDMAMIDVIVIAIIAILFTTIIIFK